MNTHKSHIVLALGSIVPTLGLLLLWVADQWFANGSWAAHANMLTIGLVVAGVYAAYMLGGLVRSQSTARRYLALLGQMDATDLKAFDMDKIADTLPPNSPWADVVNRYRDQLLLLNERLNDVEMKQAALEVRSRRNAKEHRQISAIIDNIGDPILVVDNYDELILANPRADLFNFDLEPNEKKLLADLIECQNIVRLVSDTRRRKSTAERSCELELADTDGVSRWYRATARNLVSRSDRTTAVHGEGTVAVLRDISTHKEIQKRNAEFVSSVSHEMKTPLAGIKAYVELLADGDAEDEETSQEFLEIIRLQADRLQRLVENLLNIARIEAGVVNVSKTEQSLNEILERAYEVMQPAAMEKQITLKNELSQMYLGVYVDRDMMLQTAINLLSNAIKYTPEGKSVTLRSRMVANRVELEVEDEGVGLSQEDQEKVFEKFYRVNKDKKMAAGTGLGLPLAKHIVEDVHQGQLLVKSQLEVGSTFTVQLPGAGQMH